MSMKKSGFTLAELVVTLSIIGILAALVAPALTKLVPDKNKAVVLKYYALIGNAVNDILNDESLYHPYTAYRIVGNETQYFLTIDGTNECAGLSCVSQNVSGELSKRIGNNITISGDSNSGYTLTVGTSVFNLDKYGTVTAGDAVTKAYLKDPLNLNRN